MVSQRGRIARIRMKKKIDQQNKIIDNVDIVSCKPFGKTLLCEFDSTKKKKIISIKRDVKVKNFSVSGDVNITQTRSGFVAVSPQKTNNLKCLIIKNIVGEDVLDCFEKQK